MGQGIHPLKHTGVFDLKNVNKYLIKIIKKIILVAAKQGNVCGPRWEEEFRAPETEGVCKGDPPRRACAVPWGS